MADDCVICGGPFASSGSGGNQSWARVLRIARCRPGDLTVSITGRGYQNDREYVVPKDPDFSGQNEPSEAELERHFRYSVTQLPGTRVVAFHDSCWSILLDHFSLFTAVRHEKNRIAQALYDFMHDLPHGEDWGAYLGDSRFGIQPPEVDYWVVDPNKGFMMHGRRTPPYPAGQLPASTRPWQDCFPQFPIELTYHLVSFLDSSSLCNFRLSSKFIGSLCSQYRLPQEFWASRFAVEHEMGFVPLACGSLPTVPDWRQLYFDVKDDLRRGPQISYLRSRRRVWNCISHLRPLMMILLQQDHNIQDMDSVEEDTSLLGLVVTQKTEVLTQIRQSRRKGSQYVNLDPQHWGADTIRLFVSIVTINSTAYICGFRVRIQNGTDIGEVVSLAGYVAPATETHICLNSSDDLLHVRVAVSSGGILRLGFRTRDLQGQMIWKWIGQLEGLPFYSDIVTLDAQASSRISGIIFIFDSLKAMSVQLVENLRHRASSNCLC
ncbi:unnamed protein product [Fusarium equiseti]|uniref:DUF7600 domain-containing protein n=1 Tax=Fusarium equiseti TaxID=61235 RepID=A0A8J2IRK1_FUSEQ|nr:unnamed protein product [Fusarium equiseti]